MPYLKTYLSIVLNSQKLIQLKVCSSSNLHQYIVLTHGGNKRDNVTVIYTPWSNLKKDGSMATGQVGFVNPKMVSQAVVKFEIIIVEPWQVKKILVPKRENVIINRLNKTKVEKFPDLREEKEERIKALSKKNQAAVHARVGERSIYRISC